MFTAIGMFLQASPPPVVLFVRRKSAVFVVMTMGSPSAFSSHAPFKPLDEDEEDEDEEALDEPFAFAAAGGGGLWVVAPLPPLPAAACLLSLRGRFFGLLRPPLDPLPPAAAAAAAAAAGAAGAAADDDDAAAPDFATD